MWNFVVIFLSFYSKIRNIMFVILFSFEAVVRWSNPVWWCCTNGVPMLKMVKPACLINFTVAAAFRSFGERRSTEKRYKSWFEIQGSHQSLIGNDWLGTNPGFAIECWFDPFVRALLALDFLMIWMFFILFLYRLDIIS